MTGNLINVVILTIILSLGVRNVYTEETGSDEIIAQLFSKKVEELLSSKFIELENNILKKLSNELGVNLNNQAGTTSVNEKFNDLNNALAVIRNEIKELKVQYLGRAQIIPDVKNYVLVEVDQTAKAYNQFVKRKPFVEVTVSWKNSLCCERGNKTVVTLNGRRVWSSTGFVNSATFKVSQGGRYQIQVHQCKGKRCSHSDPYEIVVADTDGSHLLPSQSSRKKSYFKPTSGKVVAALYAEKIEFTPSTSNDTVLDIPIRNMTHLLYAFAEICGAENVSFRMPRVCEPDDNFKIYINSTGPALIDSTFTKQNYYNGTFGQMMMLKRENPDLNILLAITRAFGNPFVILDDESKRDIFASSVKEFLKAWKFFNGINLVWINGENGYDDLFENIVKILRRSLDELSQETNKKYLLTITVPARQEVFSFNNYGRVNKFIDYVFLSNNMFKGPWSNDDLGYHSGLYAPAWKPSENYTTDFSTKLMINQGISSEKIVFGVVLNGMGWTGVHNYSNDYPFTGQSEGPYKQGIVSSKSMHEELASDTWEHRYDDVAEAAYLFRKDTGDLITYDDVRSTKAKAKYVKDNNLGGLFMIGEYVENDDILEAMNTGLGNKL